MHNNRDVLRRRQLSVLSDLLAGNVPSGFDEHTALSAGAQLRMRRRFEVAQAEPWLAEMPGWEEEFDNYALLHTLQCCSSCDALEFRQYCYELEHQRDWVMERELKEGLRRVGLVRRGGRHELQVGLGNKLRTFALRRATVDA